MTRTRARPGVAPGGARTPALGLALALAFAACGPVGTGEPRARGPEPVAGQDLARWLEPRGADGGHEFYVRNGSDRIHRITRVTLTHCKNVRECGEHRIDVVICPGQTRQIFASRPYAERVLGRESVSFKWHFGTTSYALGEPLVRGVC